MTAHYDGGLEVHRLSTWARLEFIRTMEILRRYLPPRAAVIAGIGEGPGVYTLPLAAEGHEVHLLDPMPLHIEQAQSASSGKNIDLASVDIDDARELPWP